MASKADMPVQPNRTMIGWQGVRFALPPEWNVTGVSLDRDSGYVRVDSPGSASMSVQVRWTNAAREEQGPPTPYYLLAPYVRKLLKRPPPAVKKTDLKQSLEKMLKDTAKDARKNRAVFESQIKPEKSEGEHRTAINFSWTGAGRGQGKIWRCDHCNRVVVAQVIGLQKDHNQISTVASQLFATIQDHSPDGFDLWALYDFEGSVPESFKLVSHKLMSGHLQLCFARGAEKIQMDRWGLANVTLKKFTEEEWFIAHAVCRTSKLERRNPPITSSHAGVKFSGALPVTARFVAVRDAKGSVRNLPSLFEGAIWHCEPSNKLFAIQVQSSRKTEGLWESVVERCRCH